MREKSMPRILQKKLREMVDYMKEGENTESAVLDAASEFGYEIEEEKDGKRNEEGGFMHTVKVVNDEGRVAWMHFNHPGPDYANHPSEWFWYIL